MAKKKTSTSKDDVKPKGGTKLGDAADQVKDQAEKAKITDAVNDTIAAADDVIENDAVVEEPGDALDDQPVADASAEVEAEEVAAAAEKTEDMPEELPAPDEDANAGDEADSPEDLSDQVPEPAPEPETAAQVIPVATQTVVERKGGFVPMVFGGLVAGLIGFGGAYYWTQQSGGNGASEFQNEVTAQLEKNAKGIAGLTDTVAQLPPPFDTTDLVTDQANLSTSMDALIDRLDTIEGQFAALDDRLTQVEKRPISEGASDAAVAAYERELKALQDTMAAQRAEIEAMAANAHSMESNAEETARLTQLRSALSEVKTALDNGAGFAPALAQLKDGGIEIPAALSDVAENGVRSAAQLQSDFPDVARAALAVSRRDAAESGEGGGFSAFLKNQLGTRSLEPREGDDPDAVLSRAEAAAREGRLSDAMTEIEALPEAGRAEMSDWVDNVTRRQAAITAVEAVSQELN